MFSVFFRYRLAHTKSSAPMPSKEQWEVFDKNYTISTHTRRPRIMPRKKRIQLGGGDDTNTEGLCTTWIGAHVNNL